MMEELKNRESTITHSLIFLVSNMGYGNLVELFKLIISAR